MRRRAELADETLALTSSRGIFKDSLDKGSKQCTARRKWGIEINLTGIEDVTRGYRRLNMK